jgi:ribosomal protein L29
MMKTKELKEIRTREPKALVKMLKDKKLEVIKLEPQIKAGKEKNLKKASLIKKEIAQISTILREIELAPKEETK